MSEIKEKIKDFTEGIVRANNEMDATILEEANLKLISFIESNYIPKEEHEKVVKYKKEMFDSTFADLTRVISEREKFKEENEILKGKAILNEKGEVLFISASDHKELMKMQRENCYHRWADGEAILSAPEPNIEDLNKE